MINPDDIRLAVADHLHLEQEHEHTDLTEVLRLTQVERPDEVLPLIANIARQLAAERPDLEGSPTAEVMARGLAYGLMFGIRAERWASEDKS